MRTVATLQEADEGEVWLDGINVLKEKDAVRRVLGYLPQEFGIYPKMSAVDMLNHLAIMKGITQRGERKSAVEALRQQTNLWDVRKKAWGTYSGGMKQRFGIAQALLGKPKLIIVDEPTAGLDPSERNRFLNLLSSIGDQVIVILSTHIVEDVRELCRHGDAHSGVGKRRFQSPGMAIISQGQLLTEGSLAEAIAALNGKIWSKAVSGPTELEQLRQQLHVISTHLVAGRTEIRVFADGSPGERHLARSAGCIFPASEPEPGELMPTCLSSRYRSLEDAAEVTARGRQSRLEC